jgi:hypothetical protein
MEPVSGDDQTASQETFVLTLAVLLQVGAERTALT